MKAKYFDSRLTSALLTFVSLVASKIVAFLISLLQRKREREREEFVRVLQCYLVFWVELVVVHILDRTINHLYLLLTFPTPDTGFF